MTTLADERLHPLLLIETSSGEVEADRMSRRANLVEGIAVYLLVQAAWWGCLGSLSRLPGLEWLRAIGVTFIGAAALFAIVMSPILHRDGWHALGLARPFELLEVSRRRAPGPKTALRIAPLAVGLFVSLLVWANWDYFLIRLSVRLMSKSAYLALTTPPWRAVGVGATALVLGALLAAFVIRWDNLYTAIRPVAWLTVTFAGGVVLVAVIRAVATGDWTEFRAFEWIGRGGNAFLTQLAVYVIWGPLQQWFMLGYFNTRMRKAISPFGRGLRSGRALAAGLTGLAFGALHFPSLPLVGITFLGGCAYGWLFQRDCCRNVFVMGFAHGLVGALLATTTSVRMMVGP